MATIIIPQARINFTLKEDQSITRLKTALDMDVEKMHLFMSMKNASERDPMTCLIKVSSLKRSVSLMPNK